MQKGHFACIVSLDTKFTDLQSEVESHQVLKGHNYS